MFVCLDQNAFRPKPGDFLLEALRDPASNFVVPDAALMEMCKSDTHWRSTLAASLASLVPVKERVWGAAAAATCSRMELLDGSIVSRADVISDRVTTTVRELIRAVGDGDLETLGSHEAAIRTANKKMREGMLNDSLNQDRVTRLLNGLKCSIPSDLQKAIRAGRISEGLFDMLVTGSAFNIFCNFPNSLSPSQLWDLACARSFAFRLVWTQVYSLLQSLRDGAWQTKKPQQFTNSEVDRHYVVIGSYFDRLLTKDAESIRSDSHLRLMLGKDKTYIEESLLLCHTTIVPQQ